MILQLETGAQLILGECPWIPGVYLAAGNLRGSQGVIMTPAELDQAIDELTRVRDVLAERERPRRRRAG